MTLRVASLIPSGTEIISALGLADTLVGRSHCCDFPPLVEALPVLSRPKVDPSLPGPEIDEVVREIMASGESVYEILMEPLLEAAPDLVITQDHCDACAVSLSDVQQAVACADLAGARVCSLHPHDLAAVLDDIGRVAEALGVPERGRVVRARMEARLAAVEARTQSVVPVRVALVEWLDPPMVAGGWIPELARIAGLEPLIVQDSGHFIETDWEGIASVEPDAVVFLPCGFDVQRTLEELGGVLPEPLREAALPRGAWVVDGDALFNRPGPRLVDSAELLQALFHPHRVEALSDFAGLVVSLTDPPVDDRIPTVGRVAHVSGG